MNQILSTENISRKSKGKVKNRNGQTDINTIIKFFAIVLIIFGIFMVASSSYAIYKNGDNGNKEEIPVTKPKISLDDKNEKQIILKVMHSQIIDKVVYYWNDEEENVINGNGSKYAERTLDIPEGKNTLHVVATDVNGQSQEVNKTYTLDSENEKLNIDMTVSGNSISITLTSEEKIEYLTYKWDDEEETKIEVNDTQYKTEIEAIKGEHTLTVYAIDVNGVETEQTKKIVGTTKPKLKLSKGDDCYVISASDEMGLDKIVIKTLADNKTYTIKAEDKEFEYNFPLSEGENRIEVTAYNTNGVTEQVKAKWTKK